MASEIKAKEVVLLTFTLQVLGPDWLDVDPKQTADLAVRTGRAIAETKENMTDLLPEGYRVKIERAMP